MSGMQKEKTDPKVIEENKRLCERFPFLVPWNRFSGKLITDCAKGEKGFWPGDPDSIPDYEYEYTELDGMPDGWRKAFGEQMCEEIREELVRVNDLDRWKIIQLKEKYGSLRLYDNGWKKESKIPEIIGKYELLSQRTCIVCGAPATRITMGWIEPYCDKCCPDERYELIEEEEKVE